MKIITLTTDFGEKDFYRGQMKGVILKLNPEVRIVDISHKIGVYDVFQGAFIISQAWKYFPEGTIHVGVVDPGVGSRRKGIIIKTSCDFFIGPDNGLFSLALKDQKVEKIIEIDEKKVEKIFNDKISKTFHGRDIFAPAGAWISKGKKPHMFGKKLKQPVRINLPEPTFQNNDVIIGEVIYIDRFGNITTNIPASLLKGKVELIIGNKRIKGPFLSYDSVPIGTPLLIVNSFGYIEIAINGGNAAKILSLERHSPIKIRRLYG